MNRALRSLTLVVTCSVAMPLLPGAVRLHAQGTAVGSSHAKQWTNKGIFTVHSGTSFKISGSMRNLGTVDVDSGASLRVRQGYLQKAGTTDVAGTLIAPSINIEGGLLDDSGTIRGSVILRNGATIQADNSVEPMKITGNLTLDNATMNEVVDPGLGYSVLDVSGTLDISNVMLQLEGLNDFSMTSGESLDILNFNGWNGGKFTDGSFVSDGRNFEVSYRTSGCATGYKDCIDVTDAPDPAPEPGSALLLAVVLGSLAIAGSHKKLLSS